MVLGDFARWVVKFIGFVALSGLFARLVLNVMLMKDFFELPRFSADVNLS